MMTEIQEIYKEDTVGRRYRAPIISKGKETRKEPEASPPMTLNLSKPMTRSEFKELNDSLKTMYIKHLHEQYGATATQISNMLGYSTSGFHRIVTELKLNSLFKGHSRSKDNKEKWAEFLGVSAESPKSAAETAETPPPDAAEEHSKITHINVSSCSFTINGAMDIAQLSQKITTMVADGTPCSVNISIEVSGEADA